VPPSCADALKIPNEMPLAGASGFSRNARGALTIHPGEPRRSTDSDVDRLQILRELDLLVEPEERAATGFDEERSAKRLEGY
jgi:hypothetical protein